MRLATLLSIFAFSLPLLASAQSNQPGAVASVDQSATATGSTGPINNEYQSATDNKNSSIFGGKYENPLFSSDAQAPNAAKTKLSPDEDRASFKQPTTTLAALEPNEFQKFLASTTGQTLPLYGATFFANPNRSAPGQATPVPLDYRLGPGDQITIRVWGSVFGEFTGNLDREGNLAIPKIGTVSLAGVRAGDAEAAIQTAIARYYKGFNISVTLGQLRGITIYVVGHARKPGTYTVSSLSTVITALFQSGGPNAIGSMRKVQVKRDGRQVAELDLYNFISKGDKSADIRLLDGDVIVIPPALGFVALSGAVEAPAVYELKSQSDTLQSILDLSGQLPVNADPTKILIERLDPKAAKPRSVNSVMLTDAALKRPLQPGDFITIHAIRPEFSNAIVLRGVIDSPIRLAFREGMKITDIIPNREFLLSRSVVGRQNDLRQSQGEAIGNKYDVINWDYAVVERLSRTELKQTLLTFNLGKALDVPTSTDNLSLQPGDTISLFSANEIRLPIGKRQTYIRIEGEILKPGVYLVEPGESLPNVIARAGGFTTDAYPFGAEFSRESVRKLQQENLDRVIRRLEQQQISDSAKSNSNISVADSTVSQVQQIKITREAELRNRMLQNLKEIKANGRLSLPISPTLTSVAALPNIKLENGDRLYVPNRPDFVQVLGAVNTEAALIWQPGRSVSDYLSIAGITQDADKDNMFVIRANGTISGNADRWVTSVGGMEVLPGDVIVLPQKLDKESFWSAFTRNAKDLTQILANFGLGAAAIKTLR